MVLMNKYRDCTTVCLFISIVNVLNKLGVSLIIYRLNNLTLVLGFYQQLSVI
jgi:hypothetical protein